METLLSDNKLNCTFLITHRPESKHDPNYNFNRFICSEKTFQRKYFISIDDTNTHTGTQTLLSKSKTMRASSLHDNFIKRHIRKLSGPINASYAGARARHWNVQSAIKIHTHPVHLAKMSQLALCFFVPPFKHVYLWFQCRESTSVSEKVAASGSVWKARRVRAHSIIYARLCSLEFARKT